MEPPGPDTLPINTMLDDRYQLLEVMHARGPITLWRGEDRILARPVAVRVVQHAERGTQGGAALDRAAEMLLSAAISSGRLVHPGAASTYDATSTTTDNGRVSYVVSEWVDGTSLQALSAHGGLRPDQATTVMLAVARVLAAAHERGIHHGDLRPSDVIVSNHGMVKVVDLGTGSVVAALENGAHSQTEPWADSTDLAADDVRALGGLLYAALTGQWPLTRECGLPPAQRTNDGRPCAPRQIRAVVPGDLDEVALATLGDGRTRRPPITSAIDLAEVLEEIAPPDGTLDLGRVRIGDEPSMTQAMAPEAGTAGYDFDPATAGRREHAYPGGNGHPGDSYSGDRYPNSRAYPGERYPPSRVAEPPPPRHDAPARRRRRGSPGARGLSATARRKLTTVVALGVTAALVVAAVVAFTQGEEKGNSAAPQPTTTTAITPAGEVLTPKSVTAFDPPPGDGEENDGSATKAFDGDPSTSWPTTGYNNTDGRQFGGYAKTGVGLRLDFDRPVTISEMRITFGIGTTSFELRQGDNAVNDVNAYSVAVAETTVTAGTATSVQVPPTVGAHRYWVVWLTKLPINPADGRFKGAVTEMSFLS